MSHQPRYIWRTALNFLVAQTPQCEWCKSRGLCPSCLLYEDKTCIFRTLLFLWKGHRLVWNIKQLMLSEIKRILEECGKLQKGFDGIYIYIAQSPADMTEWRNKDTGTKSFWGRKGGRGYSSLWIQHIIITQSENLALKMSRLLTEETDEGDVWANEPLSDSLLKAGLLCHYCFLPFCIKVTQLEWGSMLVLLSRQWR